MMETLFELRSDSGYCSVFDMFADADARRIDLVLRGVFSADELYITRVISE